MFGYYLHTVSGYLGDRFFNSLLWVSLIVSGAAIVSLLVTALFLSRQDERTRAVQQVLDVALTLAKVFGGLALTMILVISLKARQADFDHLYGRVTENNYEAVQSIWGSPHDQRNMEVRHFVEEEEIIEQIRAEDRNLQQEEGIPGEVERRFRKKVTKELRQDSIMENDHKVVIKMNYRKKGSAYYTTYEDEVDFNYVVKNRSDKTTRADFTFPLPFSQGMIQSLAVFVDDNDYADKINMEGSRIKWSLTMEPGQQNKIRVTYLSRGMDYWAFRVGGMEALNNFHLQIIIPEHEVENNPMGCMSPTKVIHDDKGTILEWNLTKAVSKLGMGVILPGHPQPGYYESALLKEAPVALFLLVIMLTLSRMLLGARMALLPIILVAFANERFFSLLAYSRGLDLPLPVSLFGSGLLMTAAVALLLLKYGDPRKVAWLQTAIFFILTVGFSICIIVEENTSSSFLLQLLYVLLLLLVMVMAVIHHRREQDGSVKHQ